MGDDLDGQLRSLLPENDPFSFSRGFLSSVLTSHINVLTLSVYTHQRLHERYIHPPPLPVNWFKGQRSTSVKTGIYRFDRSSEVSQEVL